MDLNYILNSMLVSEANSLGILEICISIILPFILSLFIASFYKKTSHTGNYSADFIYALLLFSSLTSIITLLIGSNIARAFGLVAALSLIRFRTALKSALDGIYLFWALAVGMACGVGFYFAAVLIVIFGLLLMWAAMYFRIGDNKEQTVIFKLRLEGNNSGKDAIVALEKEVKNIEFLNRLMDTKENWVEHVYSVNINKNQDPFLLKDTILKIDGVQSAEIFSSEMALFS